MSLVLVEASIQDKNKRYIYIDLYMRSYVYNVVDGVIGSIKGKYLVCCTHKCCKYKWKWNGGSMVIHINLHIC